MLVSFGHSMDEFNCRFFEKTRSVEVNERIMLKLHDREGLSPPCSIYPPLLGLR